LLSDLLHRAWRFAERKGAATSRSRVGKRFRAMGEGAWLAFPPGDIVKGSGAGGGTQYFIPDPSPFKRIH